MFPILIVDDSREDLILAERVFRSCKILNPISFMNSGEECLAYLESREAEPGLIFLDVAMPKLSGLDVLIQARKRGLGLDSIYVMLSGISDFKLLRETYQMGARTFLVKPVNTHDILELLGALKTTFDIQRKEDGYVLDWLVPPRSRSDGLSFKKKESSRIVAIQE